MCHGTRRYLAEAGLRVERLEEKLAALQDARVATSDRNKAAQASLATALSAAADRIEAITKKLNQNITHERCRGGLGL